MTDTFKPGKLYVFNPKASKSGYGLGYHIIASDSPRAWPVPRPIYDELFLVLRVVDTVDEITATLACNPDGIIGHLNFANRDWVEVENPLELQAV